ncbi:cytochrome P450 [Streptomyces sp. TLI_235]|nr:cytochrome P450 [Streptomyces sp. TLI_235]PBC66220.1 cytochrome P450 [Streptomyces sp. TLI_235]
MTVTAPEPAAGPASRQAPPPFEPADPLGWFDQVRERTPVLWHPETGSWYITRFDDVWALLTDDRLAARSAEPFLRELTDEQRTAAEPLVAFLARWPIFLDPPDHGVVRRVLRAAFSPGTTAGLAAAVGAALSTAGLPAADADDLLDSLLRPACAAALGTLLGVDPADLALLADCSERLIGFVGRRDLDLEVIRDAHEALDRLGEYVERACARGASPLAAAVGAAVRVGTLSPTDAVAIYAQLVTGALEPTVATLSVALEAVTAGPRSRQGYRSDPAGFTAEAVRLATPFHFAARRAVRELVLDEQRIPAEARVVLVLAAADRDPRRFPEPLEFRWDREQPSVAFGRGRHACLGQVVVHQVVRAVLDTLLADGGELPPVRVEWNVGLGMREPSRVTAKAAA